MRKFKNRTEVQYTLKSQPDKVFTGYYSYEVLGLLEEVKENVFFEKTLHGGYHCIRDIKELNIVI